MNQKIIFILITAASLWAVPVAQAAVDHGVEFASVRQEQGHELVLKGTSLKRFLLFKAFVAGLYTAEHVPARDVLNKDVSKRIEVSYFVTIPGHKLSNYTEELMKANLSSDEFAQLQDQLALMNQYFVDLQPGDRYALTYIPNIGTIFELNGRVIGTIQGEDFAKGIFSVWLGETPMDERVKEQILG